MKKTNPKDIDFGANMQKLDEILRCLEQSTLPLNEALELFENGVALVRESRDYLEKAEQRVTMLTRENEEVPFVK